MLRRITLQLLLTTICVSLHTVCAVQTQILIGEVELRDASRPSYVIQLPKEGSRAPSIIYKALRGESRMRMATARGQVMQCTVPASPAKKLRRATKFEDDEDGASYFSDVDGLLKEFNEKCFVRREGWWTFEFCYGKHVVQKHMTKAGDTQDEFVLGRFNAEQDAKRRARGKEILRPNAAFTQLYTGGTVCDLNGAPRQVLIKYMCLEEAVQLSDVAKSAGLVNFITAIREVESCVYELDFINGKICEQKHYKENMKTSALSIRCEMDEHEGPFEGFASESYKRSSLTI